MPEEKQYTEVNGMSFDSRTPRNVCEVLSQCHYYNHRIRLFYGDPQTGTCWMDEYDTIGYVGRSTGKYQVPLLIKTKRSTGGVSILDYCIVKITCNGATLYQNPLFNMPEVRVNGSEVSYGEDTEASQYGSVYAVCPTAEKAQRLAAFLRGERNSK